MIIQASGPLAGKRSSTLSVGFCFAAVTAVLLAQNVFSLRSPVPIELFADHTFLLTQARHMMDQQGFWQSDRSGFPLGQSAPYFPEFEPTLRLILFAIAQLPIGVFGVVKLFTVMGVIGIVVSGYWCFRRLGCGMILASVGAFVFAVSPFYGVRTAYHDYISIYVSAPFGAALAVLIARIDKATELKHLGRSGFTWVALVVIATCGLYYAFFSLMLISSALLVLAFRSRSLWPVATLVAVSGGTLVLLLVGALGPDLGHGLTGTPTRLPLEQFYFGLSISDSLYSFDWVPGIGRIIADYNVLRPTRLVGAEGAHEWPVVFVTLAILVSPLVVLYGPFTGGARDRFVAAGLIVLSILVTSRGGIGFLFNELVTPAIRGQARILPFLMFLGGFLCLSWAQDAWQSGGRWRRGLTVIVVVGLLVNTIPYANQFGRHIRQMETQPRAIEAVHSFRGVADAAQAADLHAVLELPVASWPELEPQYGYVWYTMALPGIFAPRGSRTKWSYGASRLQPGFKVFSATIRAELDPEGVASRARQIGFDGALVEKRAMPPEEAARLVATLTTARPSDCLLYNDNDRALIDIGRKPDCAPATVPDPTGPITISLKGKGGEFLDDSFALPTLSGTWAMTPNSTLFLPTPGGAGAVTVHLVFDTLPSLQPTKRLTASVDGHPVGEFAVKIGSTNVIDIQVQADLAPAGRIMPLHLHFDRPESPLSLGGVDPRPLSMLIQTVEISR